MKNRLRFNFKRFIRKRISLRMAIVLSIIVACIVPMIISQKMILLIYKDREIKKMTAEIQGQCSMLASDFVSYSYFKAGDKSQGTLDKNTIIREMEQFSYTYSCRVKLVDADFRIVDDSYAFEEGKTFIGKNIFAAFKGKTIAEYDKKTGYIDIVVPIFEEGQKGVLGVVNVSLIAQGVFEDIDYLSKLFSAFIATLTLLMTVIGLFVSKVMVKPLSRLNSSVNDVYLGRQVKNIDRRTLWEYDALAESVNVLLNKIELLEKSRQEFVSNVSHELKTPMTSMKVLADSLVNQEDIPVEIYKDFMNDIVEEVDRENQIISDLLSLVKMDQTEAKLNVTTINVNDLVELVLKRLKPIAAKKNIELTLESFRPVAAELDEVKFTLAITNLVENAIKYNNENGYVRVSVNADHKFFFVKVSDSGIGIPSDCMDHIFERFYRVDKARSRESGGTGLGLSITKNIVVMHRGTIKLYSKENEGSTFIVKIPLYYSNGGGDYNEK